MLPPSNPEQPRSRGPSQPSGGDGGRKPKGKRKPPPAINSKIAARLLSFAGRSFGPDDILDYLHRGKLRARRVGRIWHYDRSSIFELRRALILQAAQEGRPPCED
jgi:hypothetical protein